MDKPHFQWRMLLPKYWIIWLGFAIWWLLAQLPVSLQMWLGVQLGQVFKRLAKRRCQIVRRNLELCFPHIKGNEFEALYEKSLASMGRGFFEMGIGWFASARRLKKITIIEGAEHLEAAIRHNTGALVVGIHYTMIDLSCSILSMNFVIDGSYRPHKNLVYDFVQRRRRERHNETRAIKRGELRRMIRLLKEGRLCWYAPDQDYGRKNSVFVPFFGIPAATVDGTPRLAKLGQAKVIFYAFNRVDNKGKYKLTIFPPLDNFPSGDDFTDTARLNQVIEDIIQRYPDQYLWAHRRFKTRPEGENDLYRSAGIARGTRDGD